MVVVLIGNDGPAVVLDARTCAWLERHANLTALRVRVRGTDPQISQQLVQIRVAALAWRTSATGSSDDTQPEVPRDSRQWLTTGQAAELVGITDRAIRLAIREGRLVATQQQDGRYRISREDLEHFRAGRAG